MLSLFGFNNEKFGQTKKKRRTKNEGGSKNAMKKKSHLAHYLFFCVKIKIYNNSHSTQLFWQMFGISKTKLVFLAFLSPWFSTCLWTYLFRGKFTAAITRYQTQLSCADDRPKCSNSFTNIWNLNFLCHIWIQHENYISSMGCNVATIKEVVLEIGSVILRTFCQFSTFVF